MTMKRRVQRLEDRQAAKGPAAQLLYISFLEDGPDGWTNEGPHVAKFIGAGPGTDTNRAKDESAETFRARCDALLQSAP